MRGRRGGFRRGRGRGRRGGGPYAEGGEGEEEAEYDEDGKRIQVCCVYYQCKICLQSNESNHLIAYFICYTNA